ncbi:hypothetical protein, partial [Pseudomonas aeruginosa]
SNVPVSDFQGFWGAFGCSCFLMLCFAVSLWKIPRFR